MLHQCNTNSQRCYCKVAKFLVDHTSPYQKKRIFGHFNSMDQAKLFWSLMDFVLHDHYILAARVKGVKLQAAFLNSDENMRGMNGGIKEFAKRHHHLIKPKELKFILCEEFFDDDDEFDLIPHQF